MADQSPDIYITEDGDVRAGRIAHEVHKTWSVTANRDAYVHDAIYQCQDPRPVAFQARGGAASSGRSAGDGRLWFWGG